MKFHPRIHPVNYSLLRAHAPDHPAVRALQVHAEACDMCVGKEIDWPKLGLVAIDQEWFSAYRKKVMRFSAFAYQYISYDLMLDGWIEDAPELTEAEAGFLEDLPTMARLLDECEGAVEADGNEVMMPLVKKAREFLAAMEYSIRYRLEQLQQLQ